MRRVFAGLFCGALILAGATAAEAQDVREHVLKGRGLLADAARSQRVTSTPASDDARAVVSRIISVIGIPMTNFEVRASDGIMAAVATTENEGRSRLILYNPRWMDGLRAQIATDWSSWAVLAHEVGHHVAFHMDPTFPNHEAELQADYFAGFILNKLGAPMHEVLLAMAMVANDVASDTHPAKAARVAEIRKGWEAARGDVGANVIPTALPAARKLESVSTETPREQRVALLIGNAAYSKIGTPLKNPKNDVIAVGRELRRLGFSTTIVYDATLEQTRHALTAFREEAATADWAMVYYAGTGLEIDGVNYMVPVDADQSRIDSFPTDHAGASLKYAYDAVGKARRVRLVVTDSCRVNLDSYGGKVIASVAGSPIKVVEPPVGVIVAFSTAAGEFAQDGSGDLSPYAQSFVAALREPGIELQKLFRRVGAEVRNATRGAQLPSVLGHWPADDIIVSSR